MYQGIRTWLRVQKLFDSPLATETYISSTHLRSKSLAGKSQTATQRMLLPNHTVVVSIGYYIRFMARHQHRPKAQNCCAHFLNLCIYCVRKYLLRLLSFSIYNGYKIENMTDAAYILSSSSSDETSIDDDLEYQDYEEIKELVSNSRRH